MSMWKTIRTYLAASAIDQLIWSYVPVWAPTMLVMVLAYLQSRPWDIFIMMTMGAFAISVFAMFYLAQWREIKTPKDKLQFNIPAIAKVPSDPDVIPKVRSIKLGVILHNTAQFSMEFAVKEIKSRIGNRIDSRPKNIDTIFKIDSKSHMRNVDNAIELQTDIVPNGHLDGDFYIRIKYGHPKKPKFEASFAYAIYFGFDDQGDIGGVETKLIDPDSYIQGGENVTWQVHKS